MIGRAEPSRAAPGCSLMITQDLVLSTLKSVKYPGYSRDIVSFGLVKQVTVQAGKVQVSLELHSPNRAVGPQIQAECERVLRALPGLETVEVQINQPAVPGGGPDPWAQQARVPGVARTVAVASGKGGVGKSTCAVNVACGLQRLGARVGLLDCDIYGPSIPLMMGIHELPTINTDNKLVPPERHGVKLMSMGFLVEGDTPVIWRGPLIVKAIRQFLTEVDWGELDYLVVDLPPGTGDAQLTLCQTVPLDGGVIVTTPQEASLGVVRKSMAMFARVNVPILGIIENMSYFTAPNGERIEIFGHGGGRQEALRQGVPFLGEVPIYPEIRLGGDTGVPVVVSAPDSGAGQAFLRIAQALHQRLGPKARRW